MINNIIQENTDLIKRLIGNRTGRVNFGKASQLNPTSLAFKLKVRILSKERQINYENDFRNCSIMVSRGMVDNMDLQEQLGMKYPEKSEETNRLSTKLFPAFYGRIERNIFKPGEVKIEE